MANKKTTLTAALGTAFVASLAATSVAHAAGNPFAMQSLEHGYMVADAGTKAKDGKCGGEKAALVTKAKDGKCGGDKAKEAKAEEMKYTDKNMPEGKCGEGKCGGKPKADGKMTK